MAKMTAGFIRVLATVTDCLKEGAVIPFISLSDLISVLEKLSVTSGLTQVSILNTNLYIEAKSGKGAPERKLLGSEAGDY